eukprot:scaffold1054_cov281-Alexandrium_tamarense.AAC.14
MFCRDRRSGRGRGRWRGILVRWLCGFGGELVWRVKSSEVVLERMGRRVMNRYGLPHPFSHPKSDGGEITP